MKSENLNTKASNVRKLEQKSLYQNKVDESGTDLDRRNISDILVTGI